MTSKAFHSLLEISLRQCASSDNAATKEAWSYLLDVVDIVENKAKVRFSLILLQLQINIVMLVNSDVACFVAKRYK